MTNNIDLHFIVGGSQTFGRRDCAVRRASKCCNFFSEEAIYFLKSVSKNGFDEVFDSRPVYFHAESYPTTLASKGKFMTRGG